ncbi:MAG: recombinase family protein [Deltaproteobacteria bacterium]|nr:recombinase family protein [Deltaproteobacteria bacterium]
MTEEEKKGFGAWVQKKIGPEGRRISVLLNGEDFNIWRGLQQPGESHNATMHRVIREVSGQAGGDVLFEIKGMLARMTGEVSALRAEVRSLKGVSADGSAIVSPAVEVVFTANDSTNNRQPGEQTVSADFGAKIEVDVSANNSAIEMQEVADGISADVSSDIDAGIQPIISAKISAEPIAPSEVSADIGAKGETGISADVSAETMNPEVDSLSADISADDTRTLAEIKARLTTKEPRKQVLADALLPLIAPWAAKGVLQAEIAKRLNNAGIPTAHKDGTWNQSTVSGLLTRAKKSGV